MKKGLKPTVKIKCLGIILFLLCLTFNGLQPVYSQTKDVKKSEKALKENDREEVLKIAKDSSNINHNNHRENIPLVPLLPIETKAPEEYRSNNQAPSLIAATQNNNVDLVISLLKQGADVNQVDGKGKTALNYTIVKKNHEIFKTLLNTAVINRRDYDGYSPLHYAIAFEDTLIFNNLLRKGADPNVYTFNDSISPLLLAAFTKMDDFIIPLLNKGAEIKVLKTSSEQYYYSGYLHWKNAILNKEKSDIFNDEKTIALNDINEALNGFKAGVSKGRWGKAGIQALNVVSVAGASYTANYNASTNASGVGFATYRTGSSSHLNPGIDYNKIYRDICKKLLEEINNYD